MENVISQFTGSLLAVLVLCAALCVFAGFVFVSNRRLRMERNELAARMTGRTEEAIRGEAFIRTVADNLPVSISYIDRDGKFKFANKTSRDWHARARASAGGREQALSERADADAIYAELALKGEASETERALGAADGAERIVSVTRQPDIDERGFVRGYFRLGIDITERKTSEALLNKRNNFIRSVTNHLPISIAYISAAGTFQFVNRTTEIWNNAMSLNMIGRRFDEFVSLAPGDLDAVNRTLAGNSTVTEQHITYPDGVTRWVEITRIPDFDDNGVLLGYFRMAIDITERKTIDAAKEEFISTMNHELRTPLTSIKGSLSLIKSGAIGTASEGVMKLIDIASANSERLIALINDILDAQKIAAGRMDYAFKPLDLAAFLCEAIEANRGYGDSYKVRFALRTALTAAPVNADHGRLMQVMSNLLSNAAKFSPENDEVEVALDRRGASFRISVRDNGPGIPPEFHGKIFGKFAQADVSNERKKGGTGLGLNIARSIVEAHGGEIGFDCPESGGTIFFVTLPDPPAS